ncbi:MAG TPA: hypothetical protein VFP72_07350 [Kineosporiaceae bacterium]|nr:hypothetical protein [Kineosporiaceae bacterium]
MSHHDSHDSHDIHPGAGRRHHGRGRDGHHGSSGGGGDVFDDVTKLAVNAVIIIIVLAIAYAAVLGGLGWFAHWLDVQAATHPWLQGAADAIHNLADAIRIR